MATTTDGELQWTVSVDCAECRDRVLHRTAEPDRASRKNFEQYITIHGWKRIDDWWVCPRCKRGAKPQPGKE